MLIERADAKPQLHTNVVKGWDEKLVETQVGSLEPLVIGSKQMRCAQR